MPKTLDSTDSVDFTHFKRTVSHYCDNALYQNCPDGSGPPKKMAARTLDKKYFEIISTEPLIQIQNNFTEMFIIKPSTKFA